MYKSSAVSTHILISIYLYIYVFTLCLHLSQIGLLLFAMCTYIYIYIYIYIYMHEGWFVFFERLVNTTTLPGTLPRTHLFQTFWHCGLLEAVISCTTVYMKVERKDHLLPEKALITWETIQNISKFVKTNSRELFWENVRFLPGSFRDCYVVVCSETHDFLKNIFHQVVMSIPSLYGVDTDIIYIYLYIHTYMYIYSDIGIRYMPLNFLDDEALRGEPGVPVLGSSFPIANIWLCWAARAVDRESISATVPLGTFGVSGLCVMLLENPTTSPERRGVRDRPYNTCLLQSRLSFPFCRPALGPWIQQSSVITFGNTPTFSVSRQGLPSHGLENRLGWGSLWKLSKSVEIDRGCRYCRRLPLLFPKGLKMMTEIWKEIPQRTCKQTPQIANLSRPSFLLRLLRLFFLGTFFCYLVQLLRQAIRMISATNPLCHCSRNSH